MERGEVARVFAMTIVGFVFGLICGPAVERILFEPEPDITWRTQSGWYHTITEDDRFFVVRTPSWDLVPGDTITLGDTEVVVTEVDGNALTVTPNRKSP